MYEGDKGSEAWKSISSSINMVKPAYLVVNLKKGLYRNGKDLLQLRYISLFIQLLNPLLFLNLSNWPKTLLIVRLMSVAHLAIFELGVVEPPSDFPMFSLAERVH